MNLINWLDSWHLICFKGENGDLDGGDTVHNEFTRLYCEALISGNVGDFYRLYAVLVVNGIPVRHPDPNKWYSSSNRTSRDALTPYLCYNLLALHKNLPNKAIEFSLTHLKRLWMFAFNTRKNFQYPTLNQHLLLSTPDVKWDYKWKLPDFCGPDIWSLHLRIWAVKLHLRAFLYPVLCLLDLHNFLSVISLIWQYKSSPNNFNTDRRNISLKLHVSQAVCPTLISKLSWKLYKWAGIGPYSHTAWWTKAGEPPIHLWMLQLYR